MCIICVGLDNNTLTPWEAARNRKEMLEQFDEEHLKVLSEKIKSALTEYLDNLTEKNNENKQEKVNPYHN